MYEEFTMRDISLKIKNFKCFGDQLYGSETILPINIRNNSGKSSLLDLIKYATKLYDLTSLARKNSTPEVALSSLLLSSDINKVFNPGHVHAGFPRRDASIYTNTIVNGKLTVGNTSWPSFTKSFPPALREYRQRIANALTNPLGGKIFKHRRAARDIPPEADGNQPENENGRGPTNIIQQS